MDVVKLELNREEQSLILTALLDLAHHESMKMLEEMRTSDYDAEKYERSSRITKACEELTKKINCK